MAENVTIDGTTGEEIGRVTVSDQPPPEPTAEERLATLLAALTDAQSLEEIRDAAAAAGGTP